MGPELPGLVRSLPPLLLSQPAHVSRLASVLTQLVHYQQQAGVNGLHHQPHGPAAPPPQAATAQVNLSGRPAVLSSTAGSQWTGGGCSSNACTPSQHPAPGAAAAPPTYSRLLWLCASLGRQPSHWQPAGSALGPVALRAFSSSTAAVAGQGAKSSSTAGSAPTGPGSSSTSGTRSRSSDSSSSGSRAVPTAATNSTSSSSASSSPATSSTPPAAAATASGRGRVTTESRAAVEDVAVMSRNQLGRRNKAWLQEQCWQRGLDHTGLKDALVGRLLEWQAGPEGVAAAEEVRREARAVLAQQQHPPQPQHSGVGPGAPAAKAAVAAAALPAASVVPLQQQAVEVAAALAQLAAAAAQPEQQQQGSGGDVDATGTDLKPRRRRRSTTAKSVDGAGGVDATAAANTATPATPAAATPAVAAGSPAMHQHVVEGGGGLTVTITQPAAQAAPADPLSRLAAALGALQAAPSSRTAVAAARNALERLAASDSTSSTSSSSSSEGRLDGGNPTPDELAGLISSRLTSPAGLVALARACYGREEVAPGLAAALAAVLAGAAGSLSPEQLHAVLRLMAAHPAQHTGRGLRALAEALVDQGEALSPLALSESVQLLQAMGFDDAWGLYLITKEAAQRLWEFTPGDLVGLVRAMADMAVGDASLAAEVAEVVAAGAAEGRYTPELLQEVQEALGRMGLVEGA